MGGVHPFSVPCTESVDPQGEKRKAFHNKGEGNAVSEKSIRARYRRKVRVIVHVGVGKSENEDGRGVRGICLGYHKTERVDARGQRMINEIKPKVCRRAG